MDKEIRDVERRALSGDPLAQTKLQHLQDRSYAQPTPEELRSKIDSHLDTFKQQAKTALHQYIRTIFLKHQGVVEGFYWQQFTPYWDDGDATEFSYCSFMDIGEQIKFTPKFEELYFSGTDKGSQEDQDLFDAAYDDLQKLDRLLLSLEHVLQIVFGDHVQVTVDAEKFSTTPFTGHH